MERLWGVLDFELGASVVDLDLIRTAKLDEKGNATVELTSSSPVGP